MRTPTEDLEALLNALVAPGMSVLDSLPVELHSKALRSGDVLGISVSRGFCVNALILFLQRQWGDGLFELACAVRAGLEPRVGRAVLKLVLAGADRDLSLDEVRADLFSVPCLGMLRIIDVRLNHPDALLLGPDVRLVGVPPLSRVSEFEDGLMRQLEAPARLETTRVLSAAYAGDFKVACAGLRSLAGFNPASREVQVAGEVVWALLHEYLAAGLPAECTPTVSDVYFTLQLALAYEARHPAGDRDEVAARNRNMEAVLLGA